MFHTKSLGLIVLYVTSIAFAARIAVAQSPEPVEPNVAVASQWWPDLKDYWTPVGWKHHRFRYNVFFDGSILADPGLSSTAKDYTGLGVQLRVMPQQMPGHDAALDRIRRERYRLEDDNRTLQGWTTSTAPVLWTEWSNQGLLMREHIFAHVAGGKKVETGLEPLFAWVRLSIHDVLEGMPTPDRFGFVLQFNQPHIRATMKVRDNIVMNHQQSDYPRALKAEAAAYDIAKGFRIVEPDGKIRLAVAPGADTEVKFREADSNGDPILFISMPVVKGQYVDVLVPMVPTEKSVVEKELALGYDAALAAANEFWSHRPATAAIIDVPEDYINDTLVQFERYAEVLSERVPDTGKNMPLSGSLAYVKAWATPTGKLVAMYLDPMGYSELAGEFLEPFIQAQGTRTPPSSFLGKHPGFLGSPAAYKSIDWMGDHGSLLYAISNHALLCTDADKKNRYLDVVIKGCEFIRDARRTTGHGGVKGILPPARYSDRPDETQGVWNDGWNYKGLVTGARFLRQINHPRAEEFAREAEDYKSTFVEALRRATAQSTTWIDDNGSTRPFVPTSLYGAVEESARHGFYLDTGPLMLVFAGLMDPDDPIMQSALAWFREGPVQNFARPDWNHYQIGFLRREMSSCIPGYSWNVFHNHELGDRQRYLEAMYSQYVGAISRQTKTVCESRGGITGRITHADTPFYLTRLAVLDDVIAEDELHLLRVCPKAWIKSNEITRFENMPTAYGTVDMTWQLSDDGKTLQLNYDADFHHEPARVILHIPPVEGLEYVRVNETLHQVSAGGKLSL